MTDVDPTQWLGETMEPGDLVLSGSSDLISRLIQISTASHVSHVAVAVSADALLEAYDYGFTPIETDEGVFKTDLSDFVTRSNQLDRLVVRRPCGLDHALMAEVLESAITNSPPYPTAGAALMSLLLATAKPSVQRLLAALLGRGRLDAALETLVGMAADGSEQVHCSEIATRLYTAAGVELRFIEPVLLAHMHRVAAARSTGSHIVAVDHAQQHRLSSLGHSLSRRATRSGWPRPVRGNGSLTASRSKVDLSLDTGSTAMKVVRDRLDDAGIHQSDLADLILPADYERAEPFDTVGVLLKRASHWMLGEIDG